MDVLGNQDKPGVKTTPGDPKQIKNGEPVDPRAGEFHKESEIKLLRERAREEARLQGYREGFAQGKEEGFTQGFAEGVQSGVQDAHDKTQLALEPIRHLALAFSTALNGLEAAVGQQIADIALKIGQQLAVDAIKDNPLVIRKLVRSVLNSDPEMIGKPRLRANPDDIGLIKQEFGDEIEALGWKLIPDDQISRGGCKVISTNGEIDATWESRWAAVLQEYEREKPAE
jgi:flagellar assembly protein FliH